MGLLDTISLFGAAVLAIPIALLGVEFLIRGRTVTGVVFLALGVALLAGKYYLPGVSDKAAETAAGVVLGDAADADSGTGAGTGGDSGAGTDDDGTAGTDDDSVSIPDAEAGE
jgi:hypothetical protein